MKGYRDMLGLGGRTALITGVGPGIGRAITLGLAEAGAQVVISARDGDRIERLAEEVRVRGGQCLAVPADMGSEDDICRLVDSAHDVYDRVDVVINNAAAPGGTLGRSNLDLSRAEWEQAFAVNVLAPFTLISMLAPDLRRSGHGSVVNVLSTSGFAPLGGRSSAAYGSTKAALAMLTRYLAKELAPYVRVNAVCPGTIIGGKVQGDDPAWDQLRPSIAMNRLGDASEIVPPVLFLASDASSYVTGDTIFVDGGRVSTIA